MLETKVLGHCGVDSGQIFITDPCYLKHTEQVNGEWTITRELDDEGNFVKWGESENDPTLDNKKNFYTKVCDANTSGQHEVELGVVTSTTHGDGSYAVQGLYKDGELQGIFMMFVDYDRMEIELVADEDYDEEDW